MFALPLCQIGKDEERSRDGTGENSWKNLNKSVLIRENQDKH
jgi:hypothetical protein